MSKIINLIFDNIMLGNASVLTSDNIYQLNNIALELYNKKILDSNDQETLKKIIMICNVLYNRTDMDILPINDSFYDLLLEKYKVYDQNFQVGSAVVEFKNLIETDPTNINKIAHCPLIFLDDMKDKDELHQDIFNTITKLPILNKYDFGKNPLIWDDGAISKRLHDTQHNHPTLVGTLDKSKFVLNSDAIEAGVFNDANVKVLERDFFQDHINKGIIKPNQKIGIICELKYDGISIEADCDLEVESARTRGDTGAGEAADMSQILKGYTFKQAKCMIGENPIGVKFEAIITKANLEKFNELRGQSYKNGRTAIIGLFGSSDGYKYRDFITLIPLAVDRDDVPQISNRLEEIEFLNRVFTTDGQILRYCYFEGTVSEILFYVKAFLNEAQLARDYLNFMYDGIVVSYVDENIRSALGRKNYINKYSMAVKFDPLEKQTTFRGYTYTIGQNGQITPMIHYDPVEFIGTIHTKSTGSSLERFNNLGLKYGDYINVTYTNDVMPYVSKCECDHNRNNPNPVIKFIDVCPCCGSKLVISDSGKTAKCPNIDCPERSIQRMTNTMQKLNIKGFADATFRAMPEVNHLYKLCYDHNIDFYIEKLGDADGHSMMEAITSIMMDSRYDYILLGALGFSGIAQKKWQSILNNITVKELYDLYKRSIDKSDFYTNLVMVIPNIGEMTAITIAEEFGFFEKDILAISGFNIINSKGSSNENAIQIRFTGCRNLQLSELLCNMGFDADGNASVTKKTKVLIVPYDGFQSNKVSKVSPDCLIIPITEFQDNMNEILNKLKA